MSHDAPRPIAQLLSHALGARTTPPSDTPCVLCGRPVTTGNLATMPGELPDVYAHATCLIWRSSSGVEMPELES